MRRFIFLSAVVSVVSASPYPTRSARSTGSPTVKLDLATVTGISSDASATEQFLGIPFAQPPTGNLRYKLPVAIQPYKTSFSANDYGPYCLQVTDNFPGIPAYPAHSESEDCLSINVIRPAGYESEKLPVVAWIFGGGFDSGGSDGYDGSAIVQKSVNIQSPVIYVSFNHRTNGMFIFPLFSSEIIVLTIALGFGFLASQELTDAGVANLGLHDPLQMLLNNGNNEGLFRAAFSSSGSPLPIGSYTHGQKYYDGAVAAVNCTGSKDTLACLRTVPAAMLQAYFMALPDKASYQAIASPWLPRVDGKFLKEDPQQLVLKGSTDADFREFLSTVYYPNATSADIDLITGLYPSDPAVGSPFGSGDSNVVYPQYKRVAAFQGDVAFQAPRRFFLQHRAPLQNVWSYLYQRNRTSSVLGSYHTIDQFNMFGSTSNGTELQDYLINFANNLNPNGHTVPEWPQYEATSRKLLTFVDGAAFNATTISQDTYRADALTGLTAISLKYPF
ncbi:hypothetical protein HWV62_5628 [Athelia sp. TMB]|nr:hypothetical protein HWV62_5628 [Athelia sp. TMB]